jgi:predicted NACHT family NTPase
MDEMLVDVLSGLIVNAISGATAVAQRTTLARLRKSDAPPLRDRSVRDLVIPAILKLRQEFDDTEITNITKFLRSPESEVLFRHYLQTKAADQIVQREDYLKEQLAAYLHLCAGMDSSDSVRCSSILNVLYTDLAERTLEETEKDLGSPYDLREGAWKQATMADLASLARTSEFLSLLSPPQVANIARFEAIYRDQAKARHRLISPPSWDSRRQVPIDQIYIAPKLASLQALAQESAATYTIHDMATNCHRAVILGDPGAGKSTLVAKLMYDFALDRIRYTRSAPTIPFRVVLRTYANKKTSEGLSLLEYISANVKSDYMVDPPEYAIEYFLMTGRAIMLFDGLDELVATDQREQIVADVQTFANRYASTPMIVTSRSVGYGEAPLAEDLFVLSHLKDFEFNQVRDYVINWFSLSSELSRNEQEQISTAFIEESASISDLRSNPLMLALLCNLYQGEHHIPRNRTEVYRRCSVMLFERWDKDRGIIVALPFSSHIRYAVSYLAEWIYRNQSAQAGISEADLVAKTVEYLHGRLFDQKEEAEAAAEEFIAFCKGRAWVFTEVGSGLYQFAHRTFLEYFAALGLSRQIRDSDHFWSVFMPKLSRSEWDMVGQLALSSFDEAREGGASEVIGLALDSLDILSAQARLNILHWILRTMSAVVPTPSIRKRVGVAVVASMMLEVNNKEIRDSFTRTHEIPPTDLPLVVRVADDNLPTISDCLFDGLTSELESIDPVRASYAGTILMTLPELAVMEHGTLSEARITEDWQRRISEATEERKERLLELSRESLPLALAASLTGLIDLEDLLTWHGIKAFFLSLQASVRDFD